MFGIQTLLRLGATGTAAPTTGWAAKSAWAKMCDITGTQIWLGLTALPIASKLVEEAEPITYKSKLQEAERYSYYYKCLSASSTGVGVGSVVTGGTFAPLTQIIGYITAGIGLFTGVKGIYETHQKIKYYSGMLKEASETVYLTTSEIEGFTYYTLTNQQGLDCLRQYKYIQGFHPEFISNPLTWTPKLLQVNGNFIEGSKTVIQNYLQATYVLRNIKGDTEHYTSDLCRSMEVPSLNQIVLNKLEEEFSPALVEEAQKLTDIDQYIDNHLKSYQGSLWYKGAWNTETAIINKREKLEEKVTTLQKIKERGEEILREYSNIDPQEEHDSVLGVPADDERHCPELEYHSDSRNNNEALDSIYYDTCSSEISLAGVEPDYSIIAEFRWLDDNRQVQQTIFGNKIKLTANFSDQMYHSIKPHTIKVLWLDSNVEQEYTP